MVARSLAIWLQGKKLLPQQTDVISVHSSVLVMVVIPIVERSILMILVTTGIPFRITTRVIEENTMTEARLILKMGVVKMTNMVKKVPV